MNQDKHEIEVIGTKSELFKKRKEELDGILLSDNYTKTKLKRFFERSDDLNDLSVKCILWGKVFMSSYFTAPTPPFQFSIVKKFFNKHNEYNAFPRGFSKALWVETPILTNDGFKLLKDIKVNDLVFTEKGKKAKVLYKSQVYNKRKCYKVIFSDGSEIIADAQHDWLVEDNRLRERLEYKNKTENRKGSLELIKKTTEELSKQLFVKRNDDRKELNYSIPIAKPIQFIKRSVDLLVEPYFLGLWLGDGTSDSTGITTIDKDVVDYVYSYAKRLKSEVREQEAGGISKTYIITGKGKVKRRYTLQSMLRQIGVLKNKHIPKEYKIAAIRQRRQLLRGLMDSDGSISKTGHSSYTSVNKTLANDVWELLIELGIKASLNKRGKYYQVTFTTGSLIFDLKRKKERLKRKHDPRIRRRFIVDIKEIKPVPVQCLMVDNPTHLFLAGKELIPTHNTTCIQLCIAFSCAQGWDTFIVLLEKSYDEAAEVLETVRDEFKYNGLLREVYGDLLKISPRGVKDERIKDREGDFFINGVRLRARGFDKNVRGLKSRQYRPSKIIGDDVESDEHIENPDMRLKYLNNYLRGVIPAASNEIGNIKFFGTILHDDSLLSTLIRNHNGEIYQAWDKDRKLLWEDYWTAEKLEQKRQEMTIEGKGDSAWYQEYFNEPVSEEDQTFKMSMFKYFNDYQLENEIRKKDLKAYILLDPAISKQTYADFTAIVSLLVDSQHNLYIVDIIRERFDPFETTKALFAQCEKWNPFRVGIETQAYQKSLIYIINDKKHEANIGNLNIVEIKADKDKVEKIRGLVHRYAMGQVYHRQGLKNTKILETELMRFPKGATDDVIDALAGIEQILAPKRKVNQQYKHYIERTVGHRQVVY